MAVSLTVNVPGMVLVQLSEKFKDLRTKADYPNTPRYAVIAAHWLTGEKTVLSGCSPISSSNRPCHFALPLQFAE